MSYMTQREIAKDQRIAMLEIEIRGWRALAQDVVDVWENMRAEDIPTVLIPAIERLREALR